MTGITAGTGEQRSYVLGRLYERRKKRIGRPSKDEKVENFSTFCGSNDTAKGPERTICPFGESRKYIVKEGTEHVVKLTTSLGSNATAKEIAYSESST